MLGGMPRKDSFRISKIVFDNFVFYKPLLPARLFGNTSDLTQNKTFSFLQRKKDRQKGKEDDGGGEVGGGGKGNQFQVR